MGLVFTISGTSKKFGVGGLEDFGPQEKKRCRIDICTSLGVGLLPLHASLLVNGDQGVAICGPSGAGKTVLSRELEDRGYTVMANDFIVVWQEGNGLVAGDLNLESENKGKGKYRLTGICFLSPHDPRDCFRFRIDQLADFYQDVMLPLSSKTVHAFTSSRLFKHVYQLHFALGNRQSANRTVACFERCINSFTISKVGIIGVGTVGQDVANLLMTQTWLKQLNLNSLNMVSLKGKILDLKSSRSQVGISLCRSQKTLFLNSELVLVCFKSSVSKILGSHQPDERILKFDEHLELLWELSREIRRAQYGGIALIVTNPAICFRKYPTLGSL